MVVGMLCATICFLADQLSVRVSIYRYQELAVPSDDSSLHQMSASALSDLPVSAVVAAHVSVGGADLTTPLNIVIKVEKVSCQNTTSENTGTPICSLRMRRSLSTEHR